MKYLILFFSFIMAVFSKTSNYNLPSQYAGANPSKEYTDAFGIEYVYIPPGEFSMGCSEGDENCRDNEKPSHTVEISKGFYLGKTEVTQGQWEKIMGKNPSRFQDCGKDCPVEQVSRADVDEFLRRINAINPRSGRYRLPTEAEWEYAARGGKRSAYYWGESMDKNYAWYRGNSNSETHPVKEKKPNGYGLYDMLGNVWERCGDSYESGAYKKREGVTRDPLVVSDRSQVVRGGSWFDFAGSLRVSNRDSGDYANSSIGFRLLFEAFSSENLQPNPRKEVGSSLVTFCFTHLCSHLLIFIWTFIL